MPEAASVSARVEEAFRNIEAERMEGVPILNPRLEVEAIGEREWNGLSLFALVTPWFINLMLFPLTPEQRQAWGELTLGSSVSHRFPVGKFEFLVGEEEGLGRYQMCSLFSPVLEFESHEAARLTALAALDAIFDPELDKAGNEERDTADAAPAEAGQPEAPAEKTPSRRALLMGAIAPVRSGG